MNSLNSRPSSKLHSLWLEPEVEHLLEDLGEDYYNVTTASITEVRDELAALAGLTDVADQL